MPCFFTVISFASFSLSLVICQEGSDFCFSFCLYFSLPLFWFTFISMIKNNDQKQHEKKVYFGYYSQVTLLSLREIKARTLGKNLEARTKAETMLPSTSHDQLLKDSVTHNALGSPAAIIKQTHKQKAT